MSAPRIYILDDDPVFAQIVKANLGRAGEFKIELFHHPLECLDAMLEQPPDALLTDLKMPEMTGVEVTQRVRTHSPHLPVFVLTAHGEIETAIEALKAGANEYLLKPINVTELATLLRKALETRPLLEEAVSARQAKKVEYSFDAYLGEHPLVEEVRTFLRGVSGAAGVSVLLLGESGTGKNLAARSIHHGAAESRGRFVEVNCAAVPGALLEAELFGYMKGAFTDAKDSKPGLVELADGGTLFLDEIGEMDLGLQVKLLNFLESRRFRRIGGTRELEVELRVVTATNRHIDELLESGTFRKDLYYRIAGATHTLPPLRDILSDLPLMAEHFVEEFGLQFGKDTRGLSDEALAVLKGWSWPGNVRELRNVLERAMIFASGARLEAEDLPPFAQGSGAAGGPFTLDDHLTLKEAEREYIRLTLERFDGNVGDAAESLGVSRKNLWEKRKRHGLPT